MKETDLIIEKLHLIKHPEGGYFKEIYRSEENIELDALPDRYESSRCFSTSIYYLLVEDQISCFHKLQSDEIWHFYKGAPIIIHCLDTLNGYMKIKLGNKIENDIFPEHTIKRGLWFAAEVEDKNSFSLIGCTVAPGFEFEDFELAKQKELIKLFPQQKELIKKFTGDD